MKGRPSLQLVSAFAIFFLVFSSLFSIPALADHTGDPASVTLVGSLQSELGCPGDWQPECTQSYLVYDGGDDAWQGLFDLPAGSFEYKAALNDTWAENYGAGGVQPMRTCAATASTMIAGG